MKIDFEKMDGLVPAIVQDATTKNVLMLGYMNEEALEKSISTKLVTFYSRSKQRLWTKGESSGNVLELVEIKQDCDGDALLILANPKGPTCHKNTDTCWGDAPKDISFINQLEQIIEERKNSSDSKSYVRSLFDKGINTIAQKVGEEAVEIVIEAKDNNDKLFLNEAADLLFHYLILLQAKSFQLQDVVDVLKQRHQQATSNK